MSLSQVNVKLDRSVLINMAQITINTIKTCIHNCSMWSKLSHMVSIVTCCHNCHLWSQLSHVVTIVTSGDNMWSQCDYNYHILQLSDVLTIATYGHNYHMLPSKFPSLLLVLLSLRICWPLGSFVAQGNKAFYQLVLDLQLNCYGDCFLHSV